MRQKRQIQNVREIEPTSQEVAVSIAQIRTLATQQTIKIFGEINEPDDPYVQQIFDILSDPTLIHIDVVINSIGGSWNTAIMLYNILRQIGLSQICTVRTIGFGSVFSAGQLIFMQGQERIAQYGTNFLFHCTRTDLGYDSSINSYNYLEKHTKTVKRIMKALLKNYFSEEELKQMIEMSKDVYIDELEALERGIVHEVGFILPWTYDVFNKRTLKGGILDGGTSKESRHSRERCVDCSEQSSGVVDQSNCASESVDRPTRRKKSDKSNRAESKS